MWESRVCCGISKCGGSGGKVGVGLFHGFHRASFPQPSFFPVLAASRFLLVVDVGFGDGVQWEAGISPPLHIRVERIRDGIRPISLAGPCALATGRRSNLTLRSSSSPASSTSWTPAESPKTATSAPTLGWEMRPAFLGSCAASDAVPLHYWWCKSLCVCRPDSGKRV